MCSSKLQSNKELALIVSKPELLGYYSVDAARNYLPDISALKYLNHPKSKQVHLDLNQGIKSAVRSHFNDGVSISHLLQWIQLNSSKILSSEVDKWIKPDFVCSSGLLAMVLRTPFKRGDDWIICAGKWRNTIYLCRFRTPGELKFQADLPEKFSSWGFKFEQYMVSDHPDETSDTSQPVVEPAEFRCISERCFDKYNVLYSTEIDCVSSKTVLKEPLPHDLKFVELKTKKIIEYPGQERIFRSGTLLQWWSQCFAACIDELVCGFRDTVGIVSQLKTYNMDKMIEMSQFSWDPEICIDYCNRFLADVVATVVDDCDKTIYKFEKPMYGDIFVSKLSPKSEYAFIPSSFMDETG